jgi:hypothetical protein
MNIVFHGFNVNFFNYVNINVVIDLNLNAFMNLIVSNDQRA